MASTNRELRHELGAEREKLAAAVEALRGEAADVRGKLRSRVPLAAAGAVGVGIGLRAGARLLFRRHRSG